MELITLVRKEQGKEKQDKRPIDMTTDEAIDYVFGSEIAEKLKDEAGKNDPDESEDGC